ncbi:MULTISPECIES: SIR2 family protein [Paraliobacillus]|uniref:SIR2 family protein n=1 Tax=Paraliobacillus TaxID=200903 RepID=UPI000E3D430F|nr:MULTISPECIES: SIR2 family protein [Paraliobacillus]
MRKRRMFILAGNGLSVDLIHYLQLKLDTSSPLKSFHNPNIKFDPFINKLDTIKNKLMPLSHNQSDFDAMNEFLDFGHWKKYDQQNESELRKFLALSYSTFQLEMDKYNLVQWPWTMWMKKYRKDIIGLISFNYDLILENAFRQAHPITGYHRVGTNNERGGIPLFKPHGSIDFEIAPDLRTAEDNTSTWSARMNGNQIHKSNRKGFVTTVSYHDVDDFRLQPDLIPPTQENYHKERAWIQDLFKSYSNCVQHFDVNTFVIVGHSFGNPDRKEIKYFISELPKGCSFYIVNPSYNSEAIQELIAFIESNGHIVRETREYGPPHLV